jgi:hypothetical protein
MTKVSRKYQTKQQLARKRLSKKRYSNKKIGGDIKNEKFWGLYINSEVISNLTQRFETELIEAINPFINKYVVPLNKHLLLSYNTYVESVPNMLTYITPIIDNLREYNKNTITDLLNNLRKKNYTQIQNDIREAMVAIGYNDDAQNTETLTFLTDGFFENQKESAIKKNDKLITDIWAGKHIFAKLIIPEYPIELATPPKGHVLELRKKFENLETLK